MDFTYKVLESDIDLLALALSETLVAVAVKGGEAEDILELGGRICEYTPNCVRIRGLSYSRELYEFRVLTGG
ncbi:hypothetical protein [Paenibacillus sp. GCM10012306]|uniref:hypothetical protein n=1 Tax=Paenibacillus sp. GCM10012306 TaxID=3317342 RepID=UPI003620C35D